MFVLFLQAYQAERLVAEIIGLESPTDLRREPEVPMRQSA